MFDNRRVSGDLQIFCDRDKNQSRTNYVVLQPELGGSKGPRKISDKYSYLRLLYIRLRPEGACHYLLAIMSPSLSCPSLSPYVSEYKQKTKKTKVFISGSHFLQFYLNGFILTEKIYDTYQRKLLVLFSPYFLHEFPLRTLRLSQTLVGYTIR